MLRNLMGVCLFGGICFLVSFIGPSSAQSDNVVEITAKRDFVDFVIRNKLPVVAFFYSKSECKSCNWSLIPMLEKVAFNKKSIFLAKIDMDVVDLKGQQGITTDPTTRIYYQGQNPLPTVEGASWGPMIKLINQATRLK